MSWKAAAVGVVSGAAGLAVALTITAISGSDANPLQAVAESVRDLVPGSIATELVELVGHADKPLLVAGVAIGGAAIAALAGVLAVRRRWAGVAVFLLMGAVALVAAASRPGGAEGPVLAVVIGTLTWLVVLDFLRPVPELPGRRAVVILGLVASVSAVVAAGGSMIGRHRREVEAVREALSLPVGKGVVPVGADLCVDGLTPWRIPNADFYRIDTALTVPTIEPDEWRLRVHGMVERELTLTYDDLLARELTEAWVTLSCVSNTVGGSLIGNAYWSGVRVADLLAECGVHPDADAVRQTSYDGWTAGTPIEALTDGRDALLAVAMNGQPLPLEHGFPVRMVVPGLYGYVSATKWVTELEVTRFDRFDAYWTTRGWSERGPIKTESRIDVPRGRKVDAGAVTIAGVAWAPHTGIERVEVKVDDGAWVDAELARVPSVDTWVQWKVTVDLDSGRHRATVRATDGSGETQTSESAAPAPDGASGWHSVSFEAT